MTVIHGLTDANGTEDFVNHLLLVQPILLLELKTELKLKYVKNRKSVLVYLCIALKEHMQWRRHV